MAKGPEPRACERAVVKEEDNTIIALVEKYGPKKWSTISQHLPGRIGKQCRERWHNHLNPGINKNAWTQEEELTLIRAHQIYGNKWAELMKLLPGSSSKYFRQTETDVEMALDPSRVLYDMDSDDEQCLMRIRKCSDAENSGSSEITEGMFEKAMDMFEKASYVKQRDHFTLIEIQELMAGVGSLEAMETIYELWRTKRQRKGMPLIRHLQPSLWEKYQREVKNWELVMSKANTPNSYGSQKKASPIEKPAMFAFCFKPRGLEVKHKGTKHRSQKKLSGYTQHSTALGDYDVYNSSARRRSVGSGDERFLYSNHIYDL